MTARVAGGKAGGIPEVPPAAPAVYPLVGGGYAVESKSIPGALRRVWDNECSCPAGHHQSCRHRKAVQAYVREQDRKHTRPVAPPNVAALCD